MARVEIREPTFLVMTALASGPAHGYALLREVEALPGGVRMRGGTLYAVLDRLVGDGWVEVSGEEVVGGRLRRYYRLTGEGAGRLGAEVDRWKALAGAAERRLRGWGSNRAPWG